MNEIRAFVGHSFLEEDKVVVEKFLKHFDSLKRILPDFSWESAIGAEPRELSAKVFSLIKEKNVFIGICTQRERAIEDECLSPLRLNHGYAKAKYEDLQWKTSDWLLQEIGMAKGLDLDLILLVERGVRAPGGLQGDIEYIPFDRDTPEKAFDKIIEMLAVLSPKPSAAQAASPDSGSREEAEEPEQAEVPTDSDWMSPAANWTRTDYERAAFFKILYEDESGFEDIRTAYLATEDAQDESNRAAWLSRIEFIRIHLGKRGDLNKLRSLAASHPNNRAVRTNLARALSKYDSTESAQEYEQAAKNAEDNSDRQALLGKAAEQYALAGTEGRAWKLIGELRDEVELGGNNEMQLLTSIKEIAQVTEDSDVLIGALERIVQLSPSDADERFSLAYQHSQQDNDDLALFHYLKIPESDRGAIAWNNLGVSLDELRMPAKAVDAYRKAAELGDTLAMSNLGNKFLSAGFLEEAEAECAKAQAIENYHVNVATLIANVKKRPEEEDERQRKKLDGSRPKIAFYKSFGKAISLSDAKQVPPRWSGPQCTLALTISGRSIQLSGSYELEPNPLALGLTGMVVSKPSTHRVKFEGYLNGRAITAELSRTSDRPQGLLAAANLKIKVLMVIADDLKEIRVMENPHSASPNYYTLTAMPSD